MGELSKRDAEEKRENYISKLRQLKTYVREDFTEMDFENADQRDVIEGHIEEIEGYFDGLISSLENMQFS